MSSHRVPTWNPSVDDRAEQQSMQPLNLFAQMPVDLYPRFTSTVAPFDINVNTQVAAQLGQAPPFYLPSLQIASYTTSGAAHPVFQMPVNLGASHRTDVPGSSNAAPPLKQWLTMHNTSSTSSSSSTSRTPQDMLFNAQGTTAHTLNPPLHNYPESVLNLRSSIWNLVNNHGRTGGSSLPRTPQLTHRPSPRPYSGPPMPVRPLPMEIVDAILIQVGLGDRQPKLAFQVATQLRRKAVQRRLAFLVIDVDLASARGGVDALEFLKSTNTTFCVQVDSRPPKTYYYTLLENPNQPVSYYSYIAVDEASSHGHVNVLEWWKASGIQMEWMRALECASAGGCPLPNEDLDEDVIAIYGERDSCLSRRMFPKPAGVGQMDVLEWWKASGLPLHSKLSLACGSPMDWASEYGCVNALEWWKHSGWSIRLYTENSMDGASKRGHIEALEWWKSSGLELKYSHYAMDEASIAGRVEVLEWWRKSGLELKWSDRALATEKGTSLGYLWWKSKLILRLD